MRRARAPERRRAPGHGWAADTVSGSEIEGTDGTVGSGGSGTRQRRLGRGGGRYGEQQSSAAPSAARVHDVPLLRQDRASRPPQGRRCGQRSAPRVPGPVRSEGSPALISVCRPPRFCGMVGVIRRLNAGGDVPSMRDVYPVEARTHPPISHHAEHDHVVEHVAVAVEGAQDALALEADALERDLRAAVARVGPGGQAVHPEPLERERGDQRLGLEVGPAAPPAVPEPRADGGVPVARRELREAGDADRPVLVVVDQEVEQLAALALAGQRGDVGLGLGRCRCTGPTRRSG